jgi:hypothetical protein
MDSGKRVTFYYTQLRRVMEVVSIPSGEIFELLVMDFQELALEGIIFYNKSKNFYYIKQEDIWRIESLTI